MCVCQRTGKLFYSTVYVKKNLNCMKSSGVSKDPPWPPSPSFQQRLSDLKEDLCLLGLLLEADCLKYPPLVKLTDLYLFIGSSEDGEKD